MSIKDCISSYDLSYAVDGHSILKGTDKFVLNPGEFVCVSGPSGGGKTTFNNILSGLLKPASGKVFWGTNQIFPQEVKKIDTLRNEWIGMIFQEARLASSLTGWENIYLPSQLSGRKVHKETLELMLEKLFLEQGMTESELHSKLSNPVSCFSGGQMQRIAMIRALVTLPRFIFADEILNSVEPELQESIWSALKDICQTHEIGFMLITHNPLLLEDSIYKQNVYVKDGSLNFLK
jgi:ABC-type lipoprotein export system ATPase subunit